MSEAKFTNGEWGCFENGLWSDCGQWSVDNDSAGTYSNVAVNAEDVTICLVVSEGWDDSEMEANAHLIAAAPKMYAMLEKIADATVHNFNYETARPIYDLLAEARGEN